MSQLRARSAEIAARMRRDGGQLAKLGRFSPGKSLTQLDLLDKLKTSESGFPFSTPLYAAGRQSCR